MAVKWLATPRNSHERAYWADYGWTEDQPFKHKHKDEEGRGQGKGLNLQGQGQGRKIGPYGSFIW